MKIEVEIPEGKYCDGCLLMGSHDEEPYCNYLKLDLGFYCDKNFNGGYVKDKECPAYPNMTFKE